MLRRILLEEIEFALHRSLLLAEQVTLHLALDAMLERGVLAFVEHQQDRLRRRAARASPSRREQAKAAAEQAGPPPNRQQGQESLPGRPLARAAQSADARAGHRLHAPR